MCLVQKKNDRSSGTTMGRRGVPSFAPGRSVVVAQSSPLRGDIQLDDYVIKTSICQHRNPRIHRFAPHRFVGHFRELHIAHEASIGSRMLDPESDVGSGVGCWIRSRMLVPESDVGSDSPGVVVNCCSKCRLSCNVTCTSLQLVILLHVNPLIQS
jgi:hypothetical protein